MGKCNLHGLEWFSEVCAHVHEALCRGRSIPRRRRVDVDVCEPCITSLGLEEYPETVYAVPKASRAEGTEPYGILNATSHGWCLECTAAVELAASRSAGEPDPFRAFEATLTFRELDVVERLRVGLHGQYPFRPSIIERREVACRVHRGALTRPLEVTIHYVTELAEQDAILAWIDDFFEDLDLSQRRIAFYREETWGPLPGRPNHYRRGPEELLRRVEVGLPPPREPRPDLVALGIVSGDDVA